MNDNNENQNNGRRNFISGTSALALSASLLPSILTAKPQKNFDKYNSVVPKTTAEYLNLYRKVTASMEDDKEVITTFRGITYGMTTDMAMTPLHGVNVAMFTRTQGQTDGSVKFMMNIVGVYHDLKSGKILDDWVNPYTGNKVKVWHQINGPLSYQLSPETNMGLLDAEEGSTGFRFPVSANNQSLVMSTHYTTDRKNPLDPKEWPLESTGERLRTSEFNDWVVPVADILNTSKSEANFEGSWISTRPWRPFMQMGQKEGTILTPKIVSRCSSLGNLDSRILEFGEKNFPELMGAPKKWVKGIYKSNTDYFKERYKRNE